MPKDYAKKYTNEFNFLYCSTLHDDSKSQILSVEERSSKSGTGHLDKAPRVRSSSVSARGGGILDIMMSSRCL